MLSALLSDTRLACRAMRRQPGFTAVAVGTLALGIGAATAMHALVHAALLKPLPYQDPERLVLARRTVETRVLMWSLAPDYYDYRAEADGFQSLAAAGAGAVKVDCHRRGTARARVGHARLPRPVPHARRLAGGRALVHRRRRQGRRALCRQISERMARRRFGDARAAIGRSLVLVGAAPQDIVSTIVGVMPATTGSRRR